jgi:NADPH:quinone reductase-like Zn-dependent oxidoreductase
MRAAIHNRFGGPEVVRIAEVPTPTPGPDEVLVRVEATTVSMADYRMRSRDLPPGLGILGPLVLGAFRPRHPVLGMDFSGVVEQVGSAVTRFTPGDPVIGLRGSRFGSHAEYLTMPADGAIAHAPATLPLADSAALVFGGVPALLYLSVLHDLAGTRVLVNGASSATGTAAVQIAVAQGATVTAVSSAGNHELVRSLGASQVVDYTTTDFTALGQTWDVVVDCVGNAPVSRVAPVVAAGGAVLLVVASLGSMLSARRDARRIGGTVLADVPRRATASDLKRLVDLADAGSLVPVIEERYPLDDIVEAHRRVGEFRKRGALLVTIP